MKSRTRNHPVRSLLDVAAMGEMPSAEDLDEIAKLAGDSYPGATLRREVKEAASRVVSIRAEGWNGLARREARAAFEEISGKLPEPEPLPRTLPDDPRALARLALGEEVPEGEEDPRKLAAAIPRDRMS